ncbi:importin subunit alpha-2 [Tanacetum coccineum]
MFLRDFFPDNSPQHENARNVLKQLSIGRSPSIAEVSQSGVVPRLVESLGSKDPLELQLDAAWALTNIASRRSEYTKEVTGKGAVPRFVKLLESDNDSLYYQAVLGLGNIAGDSIECRNLVLEEGVLKCFSNQLNKLSALPMLKNAAWALSNFCRGKPELSCDQATSALESIQKLISSDDGQVLKEACWALSYLSDGPNDNIQAVIDSGVCCRLVKLLDSPFVLIPALRTVGNIATGNDIQTRCIINLEVLPRLLKLLTNDNKSIKKEACRTISNINFGNKDHIQKVIDAGIIDPLVDLLENSESDIKEEAAWAFLNATSFGRCTQIKYLVSHKCLKPLCALLICPVPRIVTVCLEGLENILKAGEPQEDIEPEGVNPYAQMIQDLKEFENIEKLQIHNNPKIKARATKLLKTYWDEDVDHVTPPGDLDQSGFGYGGANFNQ